MMSNASDIASAQNEKSTFVPSEVATGPFPDSTRVALTEPTEWELANLRRVGENVPPAVFLVAIAETAERFIYRCMTGPLRTCGADGGYLL